MSSAYFPLLFVVGCIIIISSRYIGYPTRVKRMDLQHKRTSEPVLIRPYSSLSIHIPTHSACLLACTMSLPNPVPHHMHVRCIKIVLYRNRA